MKTVVRHQPTNFEQSDLERKIKANLDLIYDTSIPNIRQGKVYSLSSMGGNLNELMSLYVYSLQKNKLHFDLFQKDLRYYAELFLDANTGTFELAQNPDTIVKLRPLAEKFSFQVKKTIRDGINTGDWILGFAWSIISRDSVSLNKLLRIPEEIMRQSEIKGDEYRFLYVDFLKSMYVDADLSKQKLMKAYKAAAPENLQTEKPFFALNDTSPKLELYASLLSGKKQEFNEKLFVALECYKDVVKYCKAENIPGFFINKEITAIAALAFDNGFPIEVESDYMPRFLVEGKF